MNGEVNQSILMLIHAVTQLAGICNKLVEEPTDENAVKILDIVDKCEERFLKVKDNIVIMAEKLEGADAVTGVQTENGFLIKEEK